MRTASARPLSPLRSPRRPPPSFAQGCSTTTRRAGASSCCARASRRSQRSLDERLTKIEGAATDRSALLELSSQLQGLRDDMARMRGQVEVLTNTMETADKRQKDLYLDIDTRLRKLEQTREQQAAASDKPAAAEAEASPAETKAYQAALDQFKLGNYALAVSAMQGFMVTYPQSSLAPNAQYWIGMAHSGQRDYKSAISAQRKLLAAWPDNPKAPDAMLSIASAQETMGAKGEAQKTLQELIARYPGSSASVSARQRLAASANVERRRERFPWRSDPAQLAPYVVWGAFLLAFIFGAVGNKTSFCTMGAVSDWVNMGHLGRMRMWLLAIAVALLGSSALHLAGVVDLAKSIYPGPNFTWLSYIVGGFLFGVGMTLGSGCGSKTLIRIGARQPEIAGGLCVSRHRGVHDAARHVRRLPRRGAGEGVAHPRTGPGPALALCLLRRVSPKGTWIVIIALVLGGAMAAFAYADKEFRSTFDYTLGGVVTGLVVVGGWYVSGHLGHLAEDPNTLQEAFVRTNTGRMESFSFVSPLAYTLEYLMFWTDKSKVITYGIASAAGVIAGSAAYAIATRTFRWEGFRDAEDTAMHMIGGLLMGFGGITALGCTIGQAITGFSTLALGSIITFVCIVAGAAATMKLQYWRMTREG